MIVKDLLEMLQHLPPGANLCAAAELKPGEGRVRWPVISLQYDSTNPMLVELMVGITEPYIHV